MPDMVLVGSQLPVLKKFSTFLSVLFVCLFVCLFFHSHAFLPVPAYQGCSGSGCENVRNFRHTVFIIMMSGHWCFQDQIFWFILVYFRVKAGSPKFLFLILLVCRRKSLLLQFREGPWASKVPPVMSLQFNSFTTIRVARDRNEGLTQSRPSSMDHTPRLARLKSFLKKVQKV